MFCPGSESYLYVGNECLYLKGNISTCAHSFPGVPLKWLLMIKNNSTCCFVLFSLEDMQIRQPKIVVTKTVAIQHSMMTIIIYCVAT